MMTQNDTMNEYDNEIIEREPIIYQLEIKEIWTPNLVIAKYNSNEEISYEYDIIDINDERKEYNEYKNLRKNLIDYFENILDFYDKAIFSSKNLKEIIKPRDIIQTKYLYHNMPFNLNENTTLFLFDAYKIIYPEKWIENIKKSLFDYLNNIIDLPEKPFFSIYITLRFAEISYKNLKHEIDYVFVSKKDRYSNDVNIIKSNLERDYKEYIYNFFMRHFPFSKFPFISKDSFDIKTITNLFNKLIPLNMMKKEKTKKLDTEEILNIKLLKGKDLYKDFIAFKEKALKSLGRDHPLIKAYFQYLLKFT